MTSANRLRTTSVAKITRLRNPSLFFLKRRQARREGETCAGDAAAGGIAAAPPPWVWPAALGSAMSCGLVELDTGVHPDVHEVADQFGEQADQREEVQRAEHHRVVAPDHAFIRQQA